MKISFVMEFKSVIIKEKNMFGILNFGHWDLFDICYL